MFQSKKIKQLENEIEFLKDRLWIIENPPKFKKGEKVFYKNGDNVVIDEMTVIKSYIDYRCFMTVRYKTWAYKLYSTVSNEIQAIFQEDLILTTDVEQTNNTTSARD